MQRALPPPPSWHLAEWRCDRRALAASYDHEAPQCPPLSTDGRAERPRAPDNILEPWHQSHKCCLQISHSSGGRAGWFKDINYLQPEAPTATKTGTGNAQMDYETYWPLIKKTYVKWQRKIQKKYFSFILTLWGLNYFSKYVFLAETQRCKYWGNITPLPPFRDNYF